MVGRPPLRRSVVGRQARPGRDTEGAEDTKEGSADRAPCGEPDVADRPASAGLGAISHRQVQARAREMASASASARASARARVQARARARVQAQARVQAIRSAEATGRRSAGSRLRSPTRWGWDPLRERVPGPARRSQPSSRRMRPGRWLAAPRAAWCVPAAAGGPAAWGSLRSAPVRARQARMPLPRSPVSRRARPPSRPQIASSRVLPSPRSTARASADEPPVLKDPGVKSQLRGVKGWQSRARPTRASALSGGRRAPERPAGPDAPAWVAGTRTRGRERSPRTA